MIICDFCLLRSQEGVCRIGLNIPKTMKVKLIAERRVIDESCKVS
jgi:hypothetical protein